MEPGGNLAVRIEPAFEMLGRDGVVVVVLDVILAGPDRPSRVYRSRAPAVRPRR